jgi:two-component system, NarL family, invasion response regulator UvrY
MQKVLLAEDHGIVIKAVQIIFETEFRDYTLETVKNTGDLLKALQYNEYSLVIIDLELEDGNTVLLVKDILRQYPGLNILIFSGNPEELYARKLYADGIKGYLPKQTSEKGVIAAIRSTIKGELYMSDKMTAAMVAEPNLSPGGSPFEKLSSQEMQVALLMQQGKRPSEICRELGLQSSTVATYKMKIFSKLNISNVIELKKLFANYYPDSN